MFKKLLLVACFSLFVAGCANKQIIKPVEEQPKPAVSTEEPSIRFADWQATPELKMINFSYDKSELLLQARQILKQNAQYLLANPELNVLIEGYCDERGTEAYNLALGQRRASAVREYYGKLGVPLGNIGTISYGIEKPLDPGHNEAAWSKNRRAETKVRSRKTDTLENKASEIRK